MSELHIGRIVSHREEIAPSVKVWAAAVISVPAALSAGTGLGPFIALGEQLGDTLGRQALAALDEAPAGLTAYGKGAVVGAALDVELGAAILHPRLGKPLRALLGQGKAIIPSSIKRGGPGTALDVPLHGTDNEWDFSLLDAIEMRVPDSPGPREIVIAVALARGRRPFARIGVEPSA
ncbi:amino acid synthesis family protein [Reyranella sp. CPCC 100927]|uniref:amino acid synthesis family protein n=1 Tax=Reyranella sp. CPCC 100927 TaxID=2599616 RepID=UPI0011B45A54|nr:amino acid synthesis family protein [Reyranella sp. CPCC 100927]TWT10541.1 amino acid synthesis family protein [Reyranella sp. CPCC 100927]